MIVTQTPLRISLAGGGTDFRGFYEKEHGCVVSSSIDKYIYVIIKERFDDKIRVGYSTTEFVDGPDDLKHELVREALKLVGVSKKIEISTMADIPSEGSGLGSSSSVLVGILHALHTYMGDLVTSEQLAQEACKIEIEILGKPIGKQDQYIAAYGGLRYIKFLTDGSVTVERLDIDNERQQRLSEQLMLFYTGIPRKSSSVLTEQKANIDERMKPLRAIKEQALNIREVLSNGGPLSRVGRILNEGWLCKKSLANGITSQSIDGLYESAIDAGATGGKIAGAGGGGFLLLFCPSDRQASVRSELCSLKELPISLSYDGSRVILNAR